MVQEIMANSGQNMKSKKPTFGSCPVPILNAVPPEFHKLTFSELVPGEDYTNKAIIGQICDIYPIGKRATGYIRKLLITDALDEHLENTKKLTVFLLNQFAVDSQAAEAESFIIMANFKVENSTHYKENELPLQILVEKAESQIWFGRKVAQPKPLNGAKKSKEKKKQTDETNQNPTTQKKKKDQTEEEEPVILQNHYEYIPLGELRETESKESFNVYGIVEKCGLKIIQGKKTQILELVLTDDTETGFTCSVFATKDEIFPDIYPGDIIRIHRMQVSKFRSRLKGKCPSSKFILVFSKINQGTKPRTVAKSFTFTPEDSEKVTNLFCWYNKKSEPKLISELQREDFANIICQVIGVYVAKATDVVVLKIWDGTKTNQLEGVHLGLKNEKLDEKLFLIARYYYINLSVYGQYAASAAELKPCQYIEVCDAHLYCPKNNPDDCKLCLHTGNKEGRGIHVLDSQDERIASLKERLVKIITDTNDFENLSDDDILNQNNSAFLNIDISAFNSSQGNRKDTEVNVPSTARTSSQSNRQDNEVNVPSADIEALNEPLSAKDAPEVQSTVVSEVEAAVKPGQSTQEFGEGMQRRHQNVDQSDDERMSECEPNPVINKTPMEFKSFLHNPPAQSSPSFFPLTNESDDEWWNSVPTISVTEDHTDVKPSSLAEVILHDAPYKFRTLCTVLSYKPNSTSIVDLIRLICPNCLHMTGNAQPSIDPFQERDELFYFHCPECSKESTDHTNRPVMEYTYLVVFELHDGTGPSCIEVLLWKENAVKFFKGITPEHALRNAEAATSILEMLWSICPNCRPFDSNQANENRYNVYPILDSCILSYHSADNKLYHMFDTKLI